MRHVFRLLLAGIGIAMLAGCDSPKRTVDVLRSDIADYKASPSDEAEARIDAGLEKLDGQIDQLEARGDTAAAAGYRSTEENLRADYRSARMVRSMKDAQSAIQGIGEAFKDAGRSIGDAFKEASGDPTPAP